MALTLPEGRRWAIIGLVVLLFFVAGFLLGYIPGHGTAMRLRAENEELQRTNQTLQQTLRIAELRGAAGLINYRLSENNFGAAAELVPGFFNGLKQTIEKTGDSALRENLTAILRQRDEITTGLAQTDPAVKEKIADVYASFFDIRAQG